MSFGLSAAAIGGIAAGVGAVGGALISADAAGDAADAQRQSAQEANAEQRRQFDLTREDYRPYREAGTNALARLQGLLNNPGSVADDPGYQWGLRQGQSAIDRSAAGRGGLYSGATLKALQRYGQDYGQTKLNESYNRLAGIAGIGQQATGATTAAGMNMANQIGQNALGMGNVQAASTLAQGNIWGNALNQGASALGRVNWGAGGGGGYTGTNDMTGGGDGMSWWLRNGSSGD